MARPRTYLSHPQLLREPSGEVMSGLDLPGDGLGSPRLVVGRREWIALPELGISPIHAKIDSGARTSSLHADEVEFFEDRNRVRFVTTNHAGKRIECEADVIGRNKVRSSTGVARKRLFIETEAVIAGGMKWRIRLSLANRAVMRCPMLLGRQALAGFFVIDPQGSHLLGGVRELERYVPIAPDA